MNQALSVDNLQYSMFTSQFFFTFVKLRMLVSSVKLFNSQVNLLWCLTVEQSSMGDWDVEKFSIYFNKP